MITWPKARGEAWDFPEFLWLWNRMVGRATPSLHIRMGRWLAWCRATGRNRLLLMAFRDSGKSTVVGLYCAWLLSRDPNLRIMVVAADLELSRKMVRNIRRVIERHPFTCHLKPRSPEQWSAEQITLERDGEFRDPSLLATSIAANFTGSRADIVICDDVEVPRTCETAEKRTRLREKLSEIDYVLVPEGYQIFIGTPHTVDTIYRTGPELQKNTRESEEPADLSPPYLAGFESLFLPVIGGDGKSQWPERFSLARLSEMRARSGPRKFASQMMLRPMDVSEGRLESAALLPYEDELVYREANRMPQLFLGQRRLVSASCHWDPAYGRADRGDASVVAVVYSTADGHYWLHRVFYVTHEGGKALPDLAASDEASRMCAEVATSIAPLFLPAITVEINGVGRFLPGILRRVLQQRGCGTAVREASARTPKDQRILDAFDPVLAGRRLHVHRSAWQTPFIGEMREWRPHARGRDDGLDAVAACLAAEPVRLPRVIRPDQREWRPGAGGVVARTEFPV